MSFNQIDTMDIHDALKTVRTAKCWLVGLVILALLVQVAAFVLVDFNLLNVSDSSRLAGFQGGDVAANDRDGVIAEIISWALAASKFGALVAGTLLCLTVLFSVKLSLVGRIGGPAGFLGAFYWSLLLLMVLIPWQGLLQSSFACGATFNLGQLTHMAGRARSNWGASDPSVVKQAFYYARFLGYPVLAMLMTLVVVVRFARGYRPLKTQVSTVVTPTPLVEPMDEQSI